MVSVSEMKKIEAAAVSDGIDERIMMENAGSGACRIADDEMSLSGKTVSFFCGTGNNAGDGLVFARHALLFGASVKIYFVSGWKLLKPLALENFDILKKLMKRGQDIEFCEEPCDGDILVDAMLGTGIAGKVRKDYTVAIEAFNAMRGRKISLDCPSGIDADTGSELGASVKPDMTVTFFRKKDGMNELNSGIISVVGIGVPGP